VIISEVTAAGSTGVTLTRNLDVSTGTIATIPQLQKYTLKPQKT
jgi:hypothetical protein